MEEIKKFNVRIYVQKLKLYEIVVNFAFKHKRKVCLKKIEPWNFV